MNQLLLLLFFFSFLKIGNTQIDTILLCKTGDFAYLKAIEGQYAYQWLPNKNLTNPTIYDPIAIPNENTTYIAKMIPALIGDNLIQNPDFSEGNIGFTSDYPFVERINTQGVYGVNESASNLNAIYFTDCPDRTSGDGAMMVVDGSPVANEKVWCQAIEIKPSTSYAFSAWLTSVNKENPAQLQFSINGNRIGNIFIAANQVCEWRQFFEVWESQEATQAEICIVNRNINPNGNDFALDDFAFYEIEDVVYDTTVVLLENMKIDTSVVLQVPDCGESNGTFSIEKSGGYGEISYAINGSSFQKSNLFENIAAEAFKIMVRDDYGIGANRVTCEIERTLTINQKNCPIYIPSIFSPNNDGENDRFYLQAHPDFRGVIASLSIFDRWGNRMFHAQNFETTAVSWNGTVDGKEVEESVYIYLVVVEYEDGSTEQIEGEINVVR